MSNLRRIARLEAQLAEERETHKAAMAQAEARINILVNQEGQLKASLDARQAALEASAREVAQERLERVSAQRGLVRYMTEVGLADRIGYDPDQDEIVKKDIREGRIPGRVRDLPLLKEAVTETLARRTVA